MEYYVMIHKNESILKMTMRAGIKWTSETQNWNMCGHRNIEKNESRVKEDTQKGK